MLSIISWRGRLHCDVVIRRRGARCTVRLSSVGGAQAALRCCHQFFWGQTDLHGQRRQRIRGHCHH
eukprot:717762-Prorocentrum_minimum.AAC.1